MRYFWAFNAFLFGIYSAFIYPERLETAPEWFSQKPALLPSHLWAPGARVLGVILILIGLGLIIPWGKLTEWGLILRERKHGIALFNLAIVTIVMTLAVFVAFTLGMRGTSLISSTLGTITGGVVVLILQNLLMKTKR